MKHRILEMYEIGANMAIELPEGHLKQFEDDLMNMLIILVEAHHGYVGGGFTFRLLTDEEKNA